MFNSAPGYAIYDLLSLLVMEIKIMDRTAKAIENQRNLILTTNGIIASIGLTKVGQKVGGVLVTPAIWVLNYSMQGATPDKVDVGLYAMGFLVA